MRSLTVADVMTPRPHTIRCDQNLDTARRLMRQYEVRHLPVLDGESVVGVVSHRDLYFFAGARGTEARDVTVGEVMTKAVVSVTSETTLAAATRRMLDSRAGSILVADDGVLVGIFTTRDALRVLEWLADAEEPVRRVAGKGNRGGGA